MRTPARNHCALAGGRCSPCWCTKQCSRSIRSGKEWPTGPTPPPPPHPTSCSLFLWPEKAFLGEKEGRWCKKERNTETQMSNQEYQLGIRESCAISASARRHTRGGRWLGRRRLQRRGSQDPGTAALLIWNLLRAISGARLKSASVPELI